ncbi:hypothetical protein Q6346_15285 [Isoptericola sp. b490]|uniref:hypothetical protein n=1 Tax=Actinotalea lenta TaxID=3064654 RepID=UPI002712D0C0|nr:hypothetical protein [Isoptericola sp. b490]MDO8122671.1 hypothetical protein [Isoptericola sp. b490]
MTNALVPGEVRVGQLFTLAGRDGRPSLSAALTFDEKLGVRLLVPYVEGVDQFAEASEWFRSTKPPESLLFVDDRGVVTLVGVRWRGHGGPTYRTGTLSADLVIFGQPRKLKSEYAVRELRSRVDGLDGFASFSPIHYEFPAPGEPVVIALEESEAVTWRSAGFSYALTPGATWSGISGRQFEAQSSATLVTSRSRPALPQEHLRAQWAVRDLLLIAHGKRLAWRSHQVVDEQFPVLTMDGRSHGPEPAIAQFVGTVGQHTLPEPPSTSLAFPVLNLRVVGRRGLKRWTDLYADELFRRAVQPTAEVINGAAGFLEPQLMMLASALDYFGYYRFGDGERRPMWASIQKCLDGPGLDWPQIGSREGIARAIANMDNDLKHPDRERRPAVDELACMVTLATVVARAQPFDLLGVEPGVVRQFIDSPDGHWPVEMWDHVGLKIGPHGELVRIEPGD